MGQKHRIFVEGVDDQHVIGHLLAHHQIACNPVKYAKDDDIAIKQFEGVENLLDALDLELTTNDLERVAIVLDADTEIASRWQAATYALQQCGEIALPTIPDANGTIATLQQPGRTLQIGVWLMPDNQLPGIMEDFIKLLVPDEDDLWAYAVACVEGIGARCRYPDVRRSKAEIHTWLAWQEEPGNRLGTAVQSKVLDPQAPSSQIFVAWIKRLFEE